MITCHTCGKTNGEGDIGEHWVCDSCKLPEPASTPKESARPDGQPKSAAEKSH